MKPGLVVTGAAGFLGRATRLRLAKQYRLLSTDRLRMEPVASDETILVADLEDAADRKRLWEAIRSHRPAGIVHYAAYYDFSNLPSPHYENLRDALEELIAEFHHGFEPAAAFVLASSMAAMAPCAPGELLNEESPRLGGWEYPRSKIAAEKTLESAGVETGCTHRSVELVFAGVYSEWAELVPLYQAIERVRSFSIEKFFLPAEARRGLTYVHVDDAVDAVAAALANAPPGLSRYLVGEPEPVSYREIHSTASRGFLGRQLPLWRVPVWFAKLGAQVLALFARTRRQRRFIQPWMIAFASEHFQFDLSKIQRDLRWKPRHRLKEELPQMVQRAKENREQWKAKNEARPW